MLQADIIDRPFDVPTEQVERFVKKVARLSYSEEQSRANSKWREIIEDIGLDEQGNIVKEATLQKGSNTGVYTTAMASFIEKAFRPKLIAEGIVKSLPLDMKGHDSLKIPKGVNLTANAVGADGSVTADDKNYGSLTITIDWVGCQTSLTHQLQSIGSIDLMADKLEEVGSAISRKVDTDILAEMIKAFTKGDGTYGDASIVNYSYLGVGNYITYDGLVDGIEAHENLYASPDTIVVNPTDKARLLKDTDIKGALAFQTTPDGRVLPSSREILDLKLVSTPQMTAGKIALVDSTKFGYIIDATPIETWDGRLQTTIAFEVIGAKAYGVGIPRTPAVYGIHENEAEPT